MKPRRILAMVLITLLLASCSSPTASSNESTADALPAEATPAPEVRQVVGDGSGVTLKLTFSGEEFSEEPLKAVLQEFFDETGISTEVIYVASQGGWGGYFSKIQTMIAANDTPDLIRIAVEGFRVFQDNGLIQPIDEYVEKYPEAKAVIADMHPNIMKAFTVDGKQYGITFDWNNVVTHINTDLLAERDLAMPGEDWTLADFRQLAKDLTFTREDGTKVYGVAVPNYYFAMDAWFLANGGSILNEDWTKCTLDSPEVIEMVQLFQDMIFEDGSAPQPPFDAANAFMNGLVGMHFAGRWPLRGYSDSGFTAFDVQYVPLMKERVVIQGSGIFPILTASKHPEEAFLLSVKLSSSDSQKRILEISHIPSSITVMDDIKANVTLPKNTFIFRDSADSAVVVESPPTYNDIQATFDRYLSLVFANEMAADEAMGQCAAEIDVILANY